MCQEGQKEWTVPGAHGKMECWGARPKSLCGRGGFTGSGKVNNDVTLKSTTLLNFLRGGK